MVSKVEHDIIIWADGRRTRAAWFTAHDLLISKAVTTSRVWEILEGLEKKGFLESRFESVEQLKVEGRKRPRREFGLTAAGITLGRAFREAREAAELNSTTHGLGSAAESTA